MTTEGTDPPVGLTVTHRRYVPHSDVHYGGQLIDGAYSMALFGDVATELCIRSDGTEGLLASYSDVQFTAPVRAGDVLEIEGSVISVGTRSRTLELTATVICRSRPDLGELAAEVLDEPLVATTATATVVIPLQP
jgi:3-aminobutyryl-CoA ammonia-lyase